MKKFFTVLGGMGTLATESYVRILNQRTPTHRDQDYLDYIVVNHATIPDRTSRILDPNKPNPATDLIEDVKQQSLLNPEFFVLTCNAAHYFYSEVQAATNIPILNMLQETVNEIKRLTPDAKRVGILGSDGTIKAGVYDSYIKDAGYEEIKPTPEIQELTRDLIYHDIKESGHSNGEKFHEIIRKMIEEEHCDIVILGCTELSYANEMDPETKYPVADSQSIIVDRTLERALKYQKDRK
ncbi:aspartate/glutamate racemase family protein [Limosilactobacillus fastidiosus]|uniref:Amino acid racemase n=1 Tax=Limosilactobacillus fastidiosus TaxID=2759855 RepID=A0A7W3YBN0_9LACO|nr:amino acid racemase [Limosilactobacillus fastidiosus]MBB1062589.1 amino acid racemase [Limosilactobacillus fastidiosus]MBB1085458.1 amino acid racemase [Limosilactobacillus fastidiosus]MCD7083665.1 amino acid racemase [Limosilactobacillus fastidiosus]MCD7085911.1 amino acid racemase [Limosilactobacillus fastidiosus]MCD7114445.1 amino acid racemase [Limosilactobacillus fastidiosus]